MTPIYLETARLLTRIAPLVLSDETFALKGGTGINLFVRDMPRLSVDLDLVLPDHTLPRDEAITRINEVLRLAAGRLVDHGFQVHAPGAAIGETRLFVRKGRIEVKVEVNYVLRGTVHPVRRASLTPGARNLLLSDIDVPLVSFEDLYAGKLVAAMDRQHPRDLFDVMQLLSNEGITPAIRRAFVVYLACHDRPLHEVLYPEPRDIRHDYARSFEGMTTEPVPIDELLATREQMMRDLQQGLDEDERHFLLSLARGEPNWPLLDISHLDALPGLRWKLRNLRQLKANDPRKFAWQAEALATGLGE